MVIEAGSGGNNERVMTQMWRQESFRHEFSPNQSPLGKESMLHEKARPSATYRLDELLKMHIHLDYPHLTR